MVNRTVVSSALKFGFETEEEKHGQPVIETKTISNMNGLASDEDFQAVAGEIAPLYNKVPDIVYRVDTVALEAA